jgi:probable HAF family extracellular repeat protein
MNKKLLMTVLVCALVAISAAAAAQTVQFNLLSDPISGTWSNYSLSKNGKVMAANYGGNIYRWTAASGFTFLGQTDDLSSSIGISADGSTIVASRTGDDGFVNPVRWQKSTGWINLGHPSNGCEVDSHWGSAYDTNSDGTIVVGLAWSCPAYAEGFKWTQQDGMINLGHPAGASSRASAISANGTTIVGFAENPQTGERRPVFWRNGGKKLFAGASTLGEATAVTSNGMAIVGQADDGAGIAHAFYYTSQGGMVSLGTLSGRPSDQSIANGVSDHGTVVGTSGDFFQGNLKPFIWDSTHGMSPLAKVLTAKGANIPPGIVLSNVLDISADGSTLVGTWQDQNFNQGGWMATFTK